MTFRGLSKVKSMASSYVPLRTKQLLSETFLSTGFSFLDIGLDYLKWDICILISEILSLDNSDIIE